MCLSLVASGCCVAPSIIGTFGPYTSASSKPTLWPSFDKARARFTATVVLPTPPLPLATATRFFTPGIGWRSGICCGTGTGGICFLFSDASCVGAVAFLVFFSRPAGARIVAAHFCANLHRLRRFSLRGACLILQIFLLALLAAFDFPRHGRQMLRLAGARSGGASGDGISARARWPRRRRRFGCTRRRLLPLLHLNMK